jgi:hypothetical protein
MRKLLFSIGLILAVAYSMFATPVTVSSKALTNWRYGGTTAKLRIVLNQRIVTSDGEIRMPGSINAGTWYKDVTCTVSGTTLTVPQIQYLDSTVNSDTPTATYTAVFFDSKNVKRETFLSDFRVPASLGTTLSWTQLITYNQGQARPPTPEYYSKDQTNALIGDFATADEVGDLITAATSAVSGSQTANSVFAGPTSGASAAAAFRALVANDIPSLAASKITSGTFTSSLIPSLDAAKITTGTFTDSLIPSLAASKITSGTFNTARLGSGTANSSVFLQGDSTWAEAVKPTDTRLERDLSKDYSNSLSTAVTNISSTETVLNCTQAVTVSSSISLPKNIKFRPTRECVITVSSGQTLTIGTFVNPGNVKVFTTTGTGKVLFSKGAVPEINLAWWVGNTSGGNITDALTEALETANANAGAIYVPAGQWYTTGAHTVGFGVQIRGAGNGPSYGTSFGTAITLQSPTGSNLFNIGNSTYSVRISDILLDGTGTTSKYGVLFSGTSPNTSGDMRFTNVTFQNFDIGVNYVAPDTWQLAQVYFEQCIFQNNTTAGLKTNSVNSHFTLVSTNFAVANSGAGILNAGSGPMTLIGSEFAGNPGMGAIGIKITASHGVVSLVGYQDEGIPVSIQNDASDLSGIISIDKSLIQGKVLLNQSCIVNSTSSNYLSNAFQDSGSAAALVSSRGDYVRSVDVTTTDGSTPVVSPPVLANFTAASILINEENGVNYRSTERVPRRIIGVAAHRRRGTGRRLNDADAPADALQSGLR